MLEHIRPFIDRVLADDVRFKGGLPELSLALEPLRAEDFWPADRVEFMVVRAELRALAANLQGVSEQRIKDVLRRVAATIDKYPGPATLGRPRQFPFVSKPELREIVERDYTDLSGRLLPSEAWKSAVIMAGSILEAVLYDQLTRDAARVAAAMTCAGAPRKRGGARDIQADTRDDEWSLSDMIRVAAAIGVIPAEREEIFDHALREYRNFVHPRVEVRAQFACGQSEAQLAKAVLDIVCDHLS